jgi:tubulin polyglutamylase TTLL6/13
VKPEALCQGKGIYLVNDANQVSTDEHLVAQKYISDPFLLDGLKFDLRIYVLLYGVNPLRIFMYQEGLVRLATEKYEKPQDDNLKNLYMHLTNYAINKHSSKFV